MQRNRLRLDRSWHERLGTILKTERELRQQELDRITGRAINVKSTPQVAALLYEELRLPVRKKRGSDAITTDENTLRELRAGHPNICLLYTSDAADERSSVDLGGRRIIKKKKKNKK